MRGCPCPTAYVVSLVCDGIKSNESLAGIEGSSSGSAAVMTIEDAIETDGLRGEGTAFAPRLVGDSFLDQRLGDSGMKSVRAQVDAHGFALLAGFQPGDFSATPVLDLGRPAAFCAANPVHELTPRMQDADTPNTYSGRYGFGTFPLHTDFAHWPKPPRYVLLRCQVGFEDVATHLLDGSSVIAAIGEDVAFRALVRSRRPVDGKLALLRLLSHPVQPVCIRWDETYLRAASPAGQVGLDAFARALLALPPLAVILANAGDTLVIDNWRMLHGRSAVPLERSGRIVQRAYLEALF